MGRIIRKTGIDELPQLISQIASDMSFVGSTPVPISDVNTFDRGLQRMRFRVHPGINCLWQITVLIELSFEEWLDLERVRCCSYWSDLKIFFKTVPAVLSNDRVA